MRIIFMGTPSFAVPTLTALVEAGHQVVAVYTQPPRPGGRRGKELTPTPVHQATEKLGIEVRCPVSLRDPSVQAQFAALGADVAVVAAYGLILPQAVLDAPKHGCLNVHASLLPRWRGAAPVQRAILAGDIETGITIMRMEAGLDTGPMLAMIKTAIGDYDNTDVLTVRLSLLGAQLMVQVLSNLPAYPSVPQSETGVTYADKIQKAEGRIDFRKGVRQVDRQIRAFSPSPGAWIEINRERIKVLKADILSRAPDDLTIFFSTVPGRVLNEEFAIGCGDGAIRPITVQRAGKPVMNYTDLLRGFRIPTGTLLT